MGVTRISDMPAEWSRILGEALSGSRAQVSRPDYGNEQIIAASLKENVQGAARILSGMTLAATALRLPRALAQSNKDGD